MPYYDLNRSTATNATTLTETTHLWGNTVANQEPVGISQILATARGATAGGASLRVKYNSGTVASGGTTQTPDPRNRRSSPAAQSVWKNDATTITAGLTLIQKLSFGMAQTGGTGGWVALEPADKMWMMANAVNPVDVEFTSIASGLSVPFDMTVEFNEGV